MLSSKSQGDYIVLYARVTMDTPSLDTIMGAKAGMGKADESTGTLWRGWKNIREHGVVQPTTYLASEVFASCLWCSPTSVTCSASAGCMCCSKNTRSTSPVKRSPSLLFLRPSTPPCTPS
ncbi:hypothetical protein M405DRAFT_807605, partial [Rhizopogon salebrosus TDB-379]